MDEIKKCHECERAGELIAYFYGEANAAERESFTAHLAQCGACRDELGGFAQVREAVGEWRAEILHAAPPLPFASPVMLPSQAQRETESVVAVKRSPFAALREFFTLSPVWLRAGTIAAMLTVCALAALAVVRAEVRWDDNGLAFRTGLSGQTQVAPATQIAPARDDAYSQEELSRIVAERDAVRRELEETRAQLDESREANLIAASEMLEVVPASDTSSTRNSLRRGRRASPTAQTQPKKFKEERDEEDLPRLYDLLTEAN